MLVLFWGQVCGLVLGRLVGAHGRWDRGGRRFGAGGGVAGALALGAVPFCCAFCCALMGAWGGVVVRGWSVLITFTEICNIGGGRNAI